MISGGDISGLKNSRCGTQSTPAKQAQCNSSYDAALAVATHGVAADQKAEAEAMFVEIESALYNECVAGNSSATNPQRSAAACTFSNFDPSYASKRQFTVARWSAKGAKDFAGHLAEITPTLQASKAAKEAELANPMDLIEPKLTAKKAKEYFANLNRIIEEAGDEDKGEQAKKILEDVLRELLKKYGTKDNWGEIINRAFAYPKQTQFNGSTSYEVTIKDPETNDPLVLKSFEGVKQKMEEIVGIFTFDDPKADANAKKFAAICKDPVMVDPEDRDCEKAVPNVAAQIRRLTEGDAKAQEAIFEKPEIPTVDVRVVTSGTTTTTVKRDVPLRLGFDSAKPAEMTHASLEEMEEAFHERFGIPKLTFGLGYYLSLTTQGIRPSGHSNDADEIFGPSNYNFVFQGGYNFSRTADSWKRWGLEVGFGRTRCAGESCPESDPHTHTLRFGPYVERHQAIEGSRDWSWQVRGALLLFNPLGDVQIGVDESGLMQDYAVLGLVPSAGVRYRFSRRLALRLDLEVPWGVSLGRKPLEDISDSEASDAGISVNKKFLWLKPSVGLKGTVEF